MNDKALMRARADALIGALNAFDVEGALGLFKSRAVIDDPSTGERFEHHSGIRDYFERFFVGYHTQSRILSVETQSGNTARVRVDFTGDFGHEIGRLDIAYGTDGLIVRVDADLE